jgi:aryl-alcohol dehydrogenase-like predicted oxidoreductase
LTGKYQNGAVPEVAYWAAVGRAGSTHVFDAVDAYKVAEKHDMSLAHMAMAFQRSRPFRSALFSALLRPQLEELLEARIWNCQ